MAAGYRKICVVNDGSRDGTEAIARSYDNVIYLEHSYNRGGGAALETGFEFFRRNAEVLGILYIVTFDADGQHTIDDLPKFLDAFGKDAKLDVVFGSRFIEKTDSNVPFFRRLTLWGGKWFTWAVSGIKLTDSHNGYRMLKVDAVKKIILTMDGMEYASELIEQVRLQNLKFAEVPVNIWYDEYTMGKGQRFGGMWRIASKILWWKWFR
jgi:glycosyltransferase involved in cell wall biosynthesis